MPSFCGATHQEVKITTGGLENTRVSSFFGCGSWHRSSGWGKVTRRISLLFTAAAFAFVMLVFGPASDVAWPHGTLWKMPHL